MKLLWVDEFEVETNFSREELVALLRSKVSPVASAREASAQMLAGMLYRANNMPDASLGAYRAVATGHVTRRAFWLTHRAHFPYCLIRGELRSTGQGSALAIALRPDDVCVLLILVFGIPAVSFLTAFLVFALPHGLPQGWLTLAAGLALLSFVSIAVPSWIRSRMARHRSEFENWFRESLPDPD